MINQLILLKNTPRATRPPGSISIWPRDVKWNDFGLNYRIFLEIKKNETEDPFFCSAFLIPVKDNPANAPLTFEQTVAEFLTRADPTGNGQRSVFPVPGSPDFFLLLGSVESYVKLARYLGGPVPARELLAQLNDLPTLKDDPSRAGEIQNFPRTEEFSLGILRDAKAYKAFFRGSRFLRDEHPEHSIDALRSFKFSCQLDGFSGSPHLLEVQVESGDRFSERAQCLIGANGSGKTRLLNALVTTLRSASPQNSDSIQKENVGKYSGIAFERILAFSFDGSDTFQSEDNNQQGTEYFAFDLRPRPFANGNRSPAGRDRSYGTTRLLVDILRAGELSEEDWLGGSRFTILKKSLAEFMPFDSLHLPLSPDADGYGVVTDVNGQKWLSIAGFSGLNEQRQLSLLALVEEERDITALSIKLIPIKLSSGQHIYLRFAVHFLSFIERATLVVIDEPETHLHPNLISGFMLMLLGVLEKTQSMAIIATHSPFLVREVSRDSVHIYQITDQNKVQVSHPVLKTLGASIDEISDAVFGDYFSKKYVDVIFNAFLAESPKSDGLLQQLKDKLNHAVLSRIALRLSIGRSNAQ